MERDRLREFDPEVFYNLWWYSARFSLPLPLPTSNNDNTHYCALVAWDYQVALRGCVSASKVMTSLFDNDGNLRVNPTLVEEATTDETTTSGNQTNSSTSNSSLLDSYGDYPLLSRFNLQGYYSTVWDHEDLSKILVTLVEACDKRDFRPVVECLMKVNQRRREKYGNIPANTIPGVSSMASSVTQNTSDGGNSHAIFPAASEEGNNSSLALWSSMSSSSPKSIELECYRTALYLAKYQCTSAFHAFFPATVKPCKGYHFWCPIAPVPIFDRLLHEAVKRVRAKSAGYSPFHDVSDVALGFRSVFGK